MSHTDPVHVPLGGLGGWVPVQAHVQTSLGDVLLTLLRLQVLKYCKKYEINYNNFILYLPSKMHPFPLL